jgi:hypothetical protein
MKIIIAIIIGILGLVLVSVLTGGGEIIQHYSQ